MPVTIYPNGILATPNIGAEVAAAFASSKVFFVDGDYGLDGNMGTSPDQATKTIQRAVTLASLAGDGDGCFVFVKTKAMAAGATDPSDYAETIIIPATASNLHLIGCSDNRTQGGQPQIKKGSGATALLTVRAPGCTIANLSFNGGGATGGGILLDDDGATKSAFGTSILNCFFKNCKGSSATNAATGGAIQWSSAGNAWQVRIADCRFYKNVGDIVLLGTGGSVPQDVIIENNIFSGPAASVDCNLYLAGGGGMNGVIIRNNSFTCFPALGGGTNVKQLALTGCIGVLSGNRFATSGKTFGAAGNNLVPATVFMSDNYQEAAAGASGEVGRT